ncbi:DUF948 domain-containing protein [Paenibacillus soyae]|uniref:DUF948 domain-containing protein n=1 Tax=Paenibacillus soyae TaxID=2969249 RepID=A0A9X2SAZ6_9BACL|nr:DUF948 domain-containing protein [Paenibacillus soyae]MCR2806495.1 DUF948 domain-containing protein [Paenibacillus soyae]
MAEWSAAVAAGAFVVLTAGLLIGLRLLLKRVEQTGAAVREAQADLHRLAAEISSVLQPLEESVRSVHRGLEAAEGLVQAVRQVGGTVEKTTSAVERVTDAFSSSAVKHAERIARGKQLGEAAQWAELGLTAWQLWQSSRSGKQGESE